MSRNCGSRVTGEPMSARYDSLVDVGADDAEHADEADEEAESLDAGDLGEVGVDGWEDVGDAVDVHGMTAGGVGDVVCRRGCRPVLPSSD